MNLENTIIPKSDQLNADDLIGGPRTITITGVKAGTPEQPVTINYQGDDGHPYKPGKSMRRVLVAMWGAEASDYVGRSAHAVSRPRSEVRRHGNGRDSHLARNPHRRAVQDGADCDPRQARTVHGSAAKDRKTCAGEELPDLDLARDIGATKSGQGADALREWWTGLTPALRRALADDLPGWKETAGASA
jgi:hypothetical protein